MELRNLTESVEDGNMNQVDRDHLAIKAMAVLYGMKIEIYEYDLQPSHTYGEGEQVIRLSYHEKKFWNAVVPATDFQILLDHNTAPGVFEDLCISRIQH